MRAISPQTLLAWVACGYIVLWAVRYLLRARVYLTCAVRESHARAVFPEQLDPGELRLLTRFDAELAAAGFRHLGFLHVTPLLTHYGAPLPHSAYVNERLPAYAIVRRAMAPEYGRFVEIEIRTDLGEQEDLVTLNTPYTRISTPRDLRVEGYPGASVGQLVERHQERLTAESQGPNAHDGMEPLLKSIEAEVAELHSLYRARRWIVPTANPGLERFTLRGAFALTHYSRRVFAVRVANQGRSASHEQPRPAPQPTPIAWEEQRALRVEADLHDILQVAEFPQTAPGTPWPVLTVVALTAVVSFVAMAWLWNVPVAALVLAALTLHEGGHAIAMRLLGYRDVHVFFVPLLGAMTVGRPVATSVRNRLAVLLAGPLPGLWLGVLLLMLDQVYGPERWIRVSALTLLLLNGLNLLPFTPLDGGRALETLTRPESILRLVVHGVSAAGLLALAAYTRDPLLTALGLFWAVLLPRQLQSYRLRKAVAAAVKDRGDFRGVVRATLEVLTSPTYQRMRAATRQATARIIGRAFADSNATPRDRAWGAALYLAAWIPLIVARWLWFG